MPRSDHRRPPTITAPEIERYLGIPASSVRAWTSLGKLTPLGVADGSEEDVAALRRAGVSVDARGLDVGGPREYLLEDVIVLMHESNWKRRAVHTRPKRRRGGVLTLPEQ